MQSSHQHRYLVLATWITFRESINQLIIDNLKKFARFSNYNLLQSWNGIYSKMKNGDTEFVYSPENGVTIVNGLGGAGMTLSFGLADEVVEYLCRTV